MQAFLISGVDSLVRDFGALGEENSYRLKKVIRYAIIKAKNVLIFAGGYDAVTKNQIFRNHSGV